MILCAGRHSFEVHSTKITGGAWLPPSSSCIEISLPLVLGDSLELTCTILLTWCFGVFEVVHRPIKKLLKNVEAVFFLPSGI